MNVQGWEVVAEWRHRVRAQISAEGQCKGEEEDREELYYDHSICFWEEEEELFYHGQNDLKRHAHTPSGEQGIDDR
jgi:hypothetical protein